MIKVTPHPQWIKELLGFLNPYHDRVINHRIFNDIIAGLLTIKQFQGGLINFYPLIESFPKYMALNLAKVPSGDSNWNKQTRYWLITNINQERLHTGWWKRWAVGFGVSPDVFNEEIYPPPDMDAINNYLWRICTHGSLAEGISAANFAVEGPTGEWTKRIRERIRNYSNVEGIEVNEKTFEWIEGHADFDDRHPEQALEIVKAYATTKEEQEKVKYAAKRALEYYAQALDTCYELFK
jgi:pyrroloquinoline quinone (PQQ) biosynthesis protein C